MTDEGSLSHVRSTPEGAEASMVDVSAKAVTERSALARAVIAFPEGMRERVRRGQGPKGPIEEMARAAGVLAAKRTGELIPLCHPLGLDHVELTFHDAPDDRLEVRCRAACHGRTGVEMEALTGATVAALTVYDMVKGLDKGVRIECVELLEKRGGKSGLWRSANSGADPEDPPR